MIALPWYLLAASLLLVVIGFIWANVAPPRSKPISHKMSDAEIARALNREERMSPASTMILLGFAGIGISLVCRFF